MPLKIYNYLLAKIKNPYIKSYFINKFKSKLSQGAPKHKNTINHNTDITIEANPTIKENSNSIDINPLKYVTVRLISLFIQVNILTAYERQLY